MDDVLDRMTWIITLALPLGAGLLAGGVFFAGLWWTVRHCLFLRRPGFWFVCSLLLRMSIFLSGFYVLLTLQGIRWETMASGLLGFALARAVAFRLVSGLTVKNHSNP